MKAKRMLNNCFCNDHPNQKLNLVCISQHCPRKGLICSLCKFDPEAQDNIHQTHMSKIIPFKNLINSLETSFEHQRFDPHNHQNLYLSKLDGYRDEALYLLQDTLTSLAQMMQKLQQKIIDNYENSKSALMHRGDVVRKLKSVIQKAMIHDMRKEEKYQLINDMRAMVGVIRQNHSGEFGSKYELNISPQHIIAAFMESKQNLRLNCLVVQETLAKLDLSAPVKEPLECSQIKMSKKEKKQRQRMRIFEKQSSLLDQLSEISIATQPIDMKESSMLKKQGSNIFKEQEEVKFSKPDKKKKKQKYGSKMSLGESIISKISDPLKQIVYDYIPGKKKQIDKQQMQQNLFKKEKQQKAYKMSLLLDQDIKQQKGQVPLFCHLTSSPTIKLTKFNKQAKQTAANSLAFITENIFARPLISFKIKLKHKILVGVAHLSIVIGNKSHFNSTGLQHGVYGLDQGGMCLFHNNPDQNNHKKNFYFQDHDIVNLRFDKDTLWFQKSHGKKHQKNMIAESIKLKMSQEELKGLHFCVWLGEKDDAVQII